MGLETQFTARVDVRNAVANVSVTGELDIATVPTLTDHLVHLERTDVDAIMLDLRDVTFLDCSAIHAFQRARDHAEQNGHCFILVGAGANMRRLFELTGTTFLLEDDGAALLIARFAGDGTETGGAFAIPASDVNDASDVDDVDADV